MASRASAGIHAAASSKRDRSETVESPFLRTVTARRRRAAQLRAQQKAVKEIADRTSAAEHLSAEDSNSTEEEDHLDDDDESSNVACGTKRVRSQTPPSFPASASASSESGEESEEARLPTYDFSVPGYFPPGTLLSAPPSLLAVLSNVPMQLPYRPSSDAEAEKVRLVMAFAHSFVDYEHVMGASPGSTSSPDAASSLSPASPSPLSSPTPASHSPSFSPSASASASASHEAELKLLTKRLLTFAQSQPLSSQFRMALQQMRSQAAETMAAALRGQPTSDLSDPQQQAFVELMGACVADRFHLQTRALYMPLIQTLDALLNHTDPLSFPPPPLSSSPSSLAEPDSFSFSSSSSGLRKPSFPLLPPRHQGVNWNRPLTWIDLDLDHKPLPSFTNSPRSQASSSSSSSRSANKTSNNRSKRSFPRRPLARWAHASTASNKTLFIMGGTGIHSHLADLWSFDEGGFVKYEWSEHHRHSINPKWRWPGPGTPGRGVSLEAAPPSFSVAQLRGARMIFAYQHLWVFKSGVTYIYDLGLRWALVRQPVSPPHREGCTFLVQSVAGNPYRAVLFGGNDQEAYFNDIWLFNFETFEWRSADAPKLQASPSRRTNHGSVIVGSSLYVFGGFDGSRYLDDLWVLDLNCFLWERVAAPSPPCARMGHSLVALGSRLVLFGGFDGFVSYNDLFFFDLNGLEWMTLPVAGTCPLPRYHHSMVVMADIRSSGTPSLCCYLFGGTGGARTFADLHQLAFQNDPPPSSSLDSEQIA
ncbi:MAG: kelch repeat-containing protein [archaeon]|nr:kelch repeat-containing protein [archaeon]